ncbi:histidine phosphatase family protein [Kribbella sp. NPDC005582]|uniref:histidine phosphatase family protein n=1 Tax=Kribbella sp. NPDC005582 TaxID=3156893 RepID=UPI0033B57D25
MVNLICRHAQTDYSVQHRVNGDPTYPILLNRVGRQTCRQQRASSRFSGVQSWITSEFPRTRQTGRLLMGPSTREPLVDPQLNELDYGVFEGTPFLSYGEWLGQHGADERPEGATESQREGILRMLSALAGMPNHLGDRVIIGHGLLTSVLIWGLSSHHLESLPLFLPEAPYVEPLTLSDDELKDLVTALHDRIAPSKMHR